MAKRVFWKKGMRLTDEILTMSDNCTLNIISNALALSAVGRFGLFPNLHPFKLSVDINKNTIDIVSINCLGITRNGTLIDVTYDTNYTNSFDTRTFIPMNSEDKLFLLCIGSNGEWRETHNGLCENVYTFSVIEENMEIPTNSLPIARIVYDEHCWRVDEINFIPPCLFISSSDAFEKEHAQFLHILTKLDATLPKKFVTESKDALKIFWPTIQQLRITMDKGHDLMTPMELLGNIQNCVSSFVCACTLDEYINLGEPEEFLNFIHAPYNFRNVYKLIQTGIRLCSEIYTKVENFNEIPSTQQPAEIAAPYIDREQLKQTIKCGSVKIKITNPTPGATVYYTTDGNTPSTASMSGTTIIIDSGFQDNWHKEPPRIVTIKTIAVKDGISSKMETFEIHIRKQNLFEGRRI